MHALGEKQFREDILVFVIICHTRNYKVAFPKELLCSIYIDVKSYNPYCDKVYSECKYFYGKSKLHVACHKLYRESQRVNHEMCSYILTIHPAKL
jgi:hypothetical protein